MGLAMHLAVYVGFGNQGWGMSNSYMRHSLTSKHACLDSEDQVDMPSVCRQVCLWAWRLQKDRSDAQLLGFNIGPVMRCKV